MQVENTGTFKSILLVSLSYQLSQTTLNGLHQTVRAVQDFDYNMALNVVAEIAKVGSFTEISVFMPGVKVLLQTAVQLQVYIQ